MKKRISIAVSVVALALLLIAGTVAVTVAYLTSVKQVTNTFTVGKVEITLFETPVDADGQKTSGDPVLTNEYHLLPGKTYDKDPTVTVKAGSEACWLFVKVENGISDLVVANCIEDQMADADWAELTGVAGVWYKKIDAKTTSDTEYPTFTTFTLKDDADVASLTFAQDATTADETIVVTAYAIQVAELDTAEKAWAALGN